MTDWRLVEKALESGDIEALRRLLVPFCKSREARREKMRVYVREWRKLHPLAQHDDYMRHIEKRRKYNREYQRRKKEEKDDK